jgi:hypothetical protein
MSRLLPGAGAPTVADPIPQPDSIGLLYLEVSDTPAVLMVKVRVPAGLTLSSAGLLDRRSYALTGGVRRHPRIVKDPEAVGFDTVMLTLDTAGDFSVYTLTLIGPRVDPYFATLKLRFHLGCAAPVDCFAVPAPSAQASDGVTIDYLAKDYASFRQALLDFLPTRLPDWVERSEADVGMALLELLAVTGDQLSYIQDRVSNEAFLSTATQRRSVQAHLSLLGYELDAGAAAYTWLQFQVSRPYLLRKGFQVATNAAPGGTDVVFETIADHTFTPHQNEMRMYDWGNPGACLERTATSAALIGSIDGLQPGDWLILVNLATGERDAVQLTAPMEVVPPTPITADPASPLTVVRWSAATPLTRDYSVGDTVVRGNVVLATHGVSITEVHPAEFAQSSNALVVPPSGPPGTRFHVSAFGFDDRTAQITYTVISPTGQVQESQTVPQTVIGGRPIGGLADQVVQTPDDASEGTWTMTFESSPPGMRAVATWDVSHPRRPSTQRPPRLRVPLRQGPICFVDRDVLALAGVHAEAGGAGPRSLAQVSLDVDGRPWRLVPTLLDSGPDAEVVRIETDEHGFGDLLFGRGGEGDAGQAFGRRPDPGSEFVIRYRVGGGTAGNVGQDTLTKPVSLEADWFISVTNPLAAVGGRDRESSAHARRLGPTSIQTRLVAVTADDYRAAAEQLRDQSGRREVARASAGFRWTGSWLTVALAVDPALSRDFTGDLASQLDSYLDGRRLAGYDVQPRPAAYLPLQLGLLVCVEPGFVASTVAQAVRTELGSGTNRGRPGFFSPAHFGFGEPLILSRLYERVMAVGGVQSVQVELLAPLHSQDPAGDTLRAKAAGMLQPGVDQLIQLDSDPDFPERGRLDLKVVAGR